MTRASLAVAALVLASGCGSAETGQASRSSAVTAAAGATGQPTTSASGPAPTTTVSRAAVSPRHGRTATGARFAYLVNLDCHAARTGAWAGLRTPTTEAGLRTYASGALPVVRRTALSLSRLATEHRQAAALAPLLFKYNALARLYGSATAATAGSKEIARLADSIVAAEQQVSALARERGFPFCAPVPAVR